MCNDSCRLPGKLALSSAKTHLKALRGDLGEGACRGCASMQMNNVSSLEAAMFNKA